MALTPINIIQGCSEKLSETGADIPPELRCVTGSETYQWVMNIGGVLSRPAQADKGGDTPSRPVQTDKGGDTSALLPVCPQHMNDQWRIQGGLVVPLYVVILSLMGSAVSMTRRVPEYQRRALDPKEPFTNAQAREELIFQIMQVLSAPLIVVAAYYLFGPDTRAKSVLLGFASGFASEPILLTIRGLAEKLRPADALSTTAGTAPVTVTVTPPTLPLKAGESYRFVAEVTPPTANPGVWWSIDPPPPNGGDILQTGVYTAPQPKPDALQTVTITARSAADSTKSGSATVNLS